MARHRFTKGNQEGKKAKGIKKDLRKKRIMKALESLPQLEVNDLKELALETVREGMTKGRIRIRSKVASDLLKFIIPIKTEATVDMVHTLNVKFEKFSEDDKNTTQQSSGSVK